MTTTNHYGKWVSSDTPVTGVRSNNQITWLMEELNSGSAIDLDYENYIHDMEEEGKGVLDEFAKAIPQNLEVKSVFEVGSPGPAVLSVAKKYNADFDEEWIRYEASTDTFRYCKVIEGQYSEERVFGAMDNESGWSKGTLKDEKQM